MAVDPDGETVASRGGGLPALTVAMVALTTGTFRSYQKSV
jgi:hypothetical protein